MYLLLTSRTAGPGLEPRLLGPEPSVLPLDDPAALLTSFYINIIYRKCPTCPQRFLPQRDAGGPLDLSAVALAEADDPAT